MVLFYILMAIVSGYYIFGSHRTSTTTLAWKTVSSLCFIVIGCGWYDLMPSSYGRWLCIGLVLGALGDVSLNLRECDRKHQNLWFLFGLGFFLFGHLVYIKALYRMTLEQAIFFLILSISIAALLLYILERKHWIQLNEMKLPTILYASVLLFFTFQCMMWLLHEQRMFTTMVMMGSLLFLFSDFILLFIFFGNKNNKVMTRWNLTTYYLAQCLLATTIMLY